MSRITSAFLELLDISGCDVKDWKPIDEAEMTEITQLLIPLNGFRIMQLKPLQERTSQNRT